MSQPTKTASGLDCLSTERIRAPCWLFRWSFWFWLPWWL